MTPNASRSALVYAMLAVTSGVLAWYQVSWTLALRAGLILASVACLSIFALWLGDLAAHLLASYRMAWFAPLLRQMELLSKMDREQIGAMERGRIQATGRLMPGGGIAYTIRGVGRDFDLEEWQEMVAYCLEWPKFPELPPQQGLGGSDFRDQLQAFTKTVVSHGHAVEPVGNLAARWKYDSRQVVLELLTGRV